MKFRFSLLAIATVALFGCRYDARFDASKIVDHSTIESLLGQAASTAKVEWHGSGGNAGGGLFRASVEIEGEMDEQVRAKFLRALREASQKLLAEQGTTINGWGKRGGDENLVGFSWEYSWRKNSGLIRVRYYPGPRDRGRIDVFCYEHRRDGPEPPRAHGF